MMVKLTCCVLGCLLLLAPVTSFGQVSGLALEVQPNKPAYVLGEPVELRFRVINRSVSPVSLPGGADVRLGNLRVFVAYENEGFKEYLGPGWGTKDTAGGRPIQLNPGGSLQTEATILYNRVVATAHLNERAARPIVQKYIQSAYALARPGTCRIKATLYDSRFANQVESSPAQIQVGEPQGVDLQVWNVLRNDADYGHFIQTGSGRGHPTSAKTRQIVQTLESIVNSYPASTYAEGIRRSLSSHQSSLEKLRSKGIIPALERSRSRPDVSWRRPHRPAAETGCRGRFSRILVRRLGVLIVLAPMLLAVGGCGR